MEAICRLKSAMISSATPRISSCSACSSSSSSSSCVTSAGSSSSSSSSGCRAGRPRSERTVGDSCWPFKYMSRGHAVSSAIIESRLVNVAAHGFPLRLSARRNFGSEVKSADSIELLVRSRSISELHRFNDFGMDFSELCMRNSDRSSVMRSRPASSITAVDSKLCCR